MITNHSTAHMMSVPTRWLAIVVGLLLIGTIFVGGWGSIVESVLLIVGATVQTSSPQIGRWLIWVSASLLSVLTLPTGVALLIGDVKLLRSYHDNVILGVFSLTVVAVLLMVCLDIALVVDALYSGIGHKSRRHKRKRLIFVGLIGATLLVGSMNAYFRSASSYGTLVWRGDEAILLVRSAHDGFRYRYLTLPLIAAGMFFLVPPQPAYRHFITTVIKVTPNGVERTTVDYGEEAAGQPFFLTPFDDGIYAECIGMILCKWNGEQFTAATAEESKRIGGVKHLMMDDFDGKVINGWMMRDLGRGTNEPITVEIGKEVSISAERDSGRVLLIDLLRRGQPPQNLYKEAGGIPWVNRREYDRFNPNAK